MKFELPHSHGDGRDTEKLRKQLTDDARFTGVSERFKLLSDVNRLRIFWLLCHREECVINLAALMNMSSPAVSYHLSALSSGGLVISRRDKKEAYYRVPDTEECRLLHVLVEQVMEVACPKETIDAQSSPEETVRKVHDYMIEHLSERFTIEQLSEKYLMNTTTLKKAFKRVYGTSIANHMKTHRLERAAELLARTGESVAAIADAVGYESQSRFTAAFRTGYGVSPTEYRKRNAENAGGSEKNVSWRG